MISYKNFKIFLMVFISVSFLFLAVFSVYAQDEDFIDETEQIEQIDEQFEDESQDEQQNEVQSEKQPEQEKEQIKIKEQEKKEKPSFITNYISKKVLNEKTKKIIMEISDKLNGAVGGCIEGEYEKVEENFHGFLEKLNSLELMPEEIEFLLTDCENILRKIKNMNDIYVNKDNLYRNKMTTISLEYDENTINKWMNIYTGKKGTAKNNMRIALERSGKYKDMILSILKEYDLPEELVYLPIIESMFNNNCVSRAKAVGLWQIMAHRGQALGLKINYWIDERRDPEKATRAAARYLQELFFLLNDWHFALSAYNRGEYGLIRDLKFSNSSSMVDMKNRNATPKETQNYVPQFIVAVKIAKDPETYGFHNLKFEKPFIYDTVITDKVIDLKIVAKCAGTTVEKIKELNPALLAWCTPHGYKNFELHIPEGTKDIFYENIVKEKDLNPSPGFIKYKVKKGEYLEKIARDFKTTVSAIKEDNPKLKKQKYLQPNQVLVIRPGRKYYNKK